jgi:Fe-S-cluster-containing hydrogenase component 2
MVHPKPKGSVWDWIKGLVGVEPELPETGQTVAVKCDLCRDIRGGPACVRSCPTEAALRLDGEEYRARLEDLVVQRGAG